MANGHDGLDQKVQRHNLVYFSACSTFKVPNALRKINKKAYEPQVISIGPYHHGEKHLKVMEVQKMNTLKLFLDRTGEDSVERYVTALETMEGEVREFYSEPQYYIGRKKLVEMMLLDGCFIIELIFHGTMEKLLPDFYLRKAMRDLLLVENQLPLSVLSKLYSLHEGQQLNDAKNRILEGVISFYKRMMPGYPINALPRNQDIKHILGLFHDISYPSEEIVTWRPPPVPPSLETPGSSKMQKWHFIPSATELNEAGIEFREKEEKLLDIKFEMGVISIPTLIIDDDKESILQNLVAYEQCYKGISSKCFASYIAFMSCLINTRQDVELLFGRGVLDNRLGDHEVVATMFNRLHDSVLLSDEDFIYFDIFDRVNKHYNEWWNRWKASLVHYYFNTPWAMISFYNGVVVFLLSTVLQTLFSILSYYHK